MTPPSETVEDAIRISAEAVAVGISRRFLQPGRDVRNAHPGRRGSHAWGLPVVCRAYPSGEMWGDRKGSTESVLYASRAAAELGTDIVQTWYTGSTAEFAEVVEGTPAIVVAAGGAPVTNPLDVLKQAASRDRSRRPRHDRRPQHLG